MFGIKRRRQIAHEYAQMRLALEWYADSNNWKRRAAHAPGEPVKWIKSPAAFDRGARAKFVVTLVLDRQASGKGDRPAVEVGPSDPYFSKRFVGIYASDEAHGSEPTP